MYNKIDHVKLQRMLRSGRSVAQCAEFFKCTKQAIHQAKNRIDKAVAKDLATRSAPQIVQAEYNTVKKFAKAQNETMELIELLSGLIRGEPNAMDQMQRMHELRGIKWEDPVALQVKLLGELRRQVQLQSEIYSSYASLKSMQEFQAEVINIIMSVVPERRKDIIERLRERRALAGALEFSRTD